MRSKCNSKLCAQKKKFEVKLAKVLRKFVFYIRQKELRGENREGRPLSQGLNRKVISVNVRSNNDKDAIDTLLFAYSNLRDQISTECSKKLDLPIL